MSARESVWSEEVRPALVLLTNPGPESLWDPELSQLVDQLEERLDGAHVTQATPSGGGPSPEDALAAARFTGAPWAVIAAPSDDVISARLVRPAAIPAVHVRCTWDADSISSAYEHARQVVARAADELALSAALEALAAGG